MTEGTFVYFQQAAKLISDTYERKARLYPALLLLMPVGVVLCLGLGPNFTVTKAICGLLMTCGGLLLLSQIARDGGKRREPGLFTKWGGMPSIAIFRHRDKRIDSVTKAKYHAQMAKLVPGANAPSLEFETADPDAADQVYRAWSTYVRVNTRDTKKYSLLFQENINYGYRRNVWGMKPVGVLISALSVAAAASWLWLLYQSSAKISVELSGAAAVDFALLLLWVFHFTSDWVRIPAEAYAERLVEAIDSLAKKPQRKSANA